MPAQFFSAKVTTAGTPQNLGASATPAGPVVSSGSQTFPQGSVEIGGSVILLQADPSNTAAKSIYVGGPGLSVSGRTGVGMVLAPGAFSPAIQVGDGFARLTDFWIDTDGTSATEQVFVTVVG